MNAIRSTLAYLRARLDERSTWLLFGASITAAAALPWPWSAISCAVGMIGALTPDGAVKPSNQGSGQ
jgi:hypothetical protein